MSTHCPAPDTQTQPVSSTEYEVPLSMIVPELVGKTYHIKTFGCQDDLHDTERVSGLL